MKAIIPYAILGIVGTAGAVAGVSGAVGSPDAPQPNAPVTSPKDAPVIVHTALDRTALPQNGGDVFARVALEGVLPKDTQTQRVPVSLTLVIDRSGSMGSGSKMADAKRAAADAIGTLRAGDQVCVVSFDDGAEDHGCATVGEGTAGASSTAALYSAIERLHARGGTDMVAGLAVGGNAARKIQSAQRVNRLLLLSDGRPNTEAGLREAVSALAKNGVQTTTLGLGADYNEDLMASLADNGLGKYYFVENGAQLAGIFAEELKSLAAVVAREASIELTPKNGASILEVIGFISHKNGEIVNVPAGDIYGGRTTDILVKLRVPAQTGLKDVLAAKVRYTDAKKGDRGGEDRVLAALFTGDETKIAASIQKDVAVKAEKYQAAQEWVRANDAYNRGDKAAGDTILQGTSARLRAKSAELGAKDLAEEAAETEAYKVKNEVNGEGWRGAGSKAAKKKAWSMNKGSAY